jgi:hypothetical protein
MTIHKRYHILACTAALIGALAFLATISRTGSDFLQDQRPKRAGGSAEEAFAFACQALNNYFPTLETGPVLIDPEFRATLLSKSKIWTIKGYAFCPSNATRSYRWTVILSCDDAQEWEILAKIVTPEFTTAARTQMDGKSHVQGTLFDADHDR